MKHLGDWIEENQIYRQAQKFAIFVSFKIGIEIHFHRDPIF